MKGMRWAVFWLCAYVVLVCSPLLVLMVAPVPAKRGFWWETAIGLGFAGLIMMVMQFVLTARFRRPTAPFGIDLIYYFHRYLAYTLLAIVLAHPLLLVAKDPGLLDRLNPLTASWAMRTGMLSLFALLALIATSAWRKRLGIPYDSWRFAHLLLAVLSVGLAFGHLGLIDYYSNTFIVSLLWLVIGISVLLIQLQVRLFRPWALARKPWTVRSVVPERGDACTLSLQPQGHAGIRFQPGQFAWLSLGHSPFSMQEHPFSIACPPQRDGSVQVTIKALGDFTGAVSTTPIGSTAYVDGPYGVFSCDRHPHAPGYVFIGGGIGVAPLLGMLESLADRGDSRPHLLFTAHSEWARIPRREAFEQLTERLALTFVAVLEKPRGLERSAELGQPQPPVAAWHSEQGWMTRAILERYLPADFREYHYFICGPQAMTQAVESFLHQLRVPLRHIHTELFDMA